MFKNTSELGSFGEFCYQKYVKIKGLQIIKEGIIECDFIVSGNRRVDVKSTQTSNKKYCGKRYGSDISYDLISVANDVVKVFPDKESPIKEFGESLIGNFEDLWNEWKSQLSINKVKIFNRHRENRRIIEMKLKKFFIEKSKSVRVIFRGSVTSRWATAPDNLPGRESVYSKYDFTAFVQMQTVGTEEKISEIYIFDKSEFDHIKMLDPDSRQSNKGISRVVDLKSYKNDDYFKEYVFAGIEDLYLRFSLEND